MTRFFNEMWGMIHMAKRMVYEIRVRGHLTVNQWRDWFGGLTMENFPGGETRLYGPVADQAALHGTLNRIRDLGLTLVYLRALEVETDERG